MKAIETRYNGHRFRSRAEARFAVMLDSLGEPYQYEPEGYEFDDASRYLPDFWLPNQESYVEIKGARPTKDEQRLALKLSQNSGKTVFIFASEDSQTIPIARTFACIWKDIPETPYWAMWAECPQCKRVDICPGWGAILWLRCDCPTQTIRGTFDFDTWEDKREIIRNPTSEKLMKAYAAARSARFEHGESGADF